jgi:Acetyltransferase (GNAT) domain
MELGRSATPSLAPRQRHGAQSCTTATLQPTSVLVEGVSICTFEVLLGYPDGDADSAWRQFLGVADVATHYTAPEFFREVFPETAKPLAVLARDADDGRVRGVVTGVREGDRLTCGLWSRPQVSLDPTADPEPVVLALFEGLLSAAPGCRLISLHSWTPLDALRTRCTRCQREDGVVVLDLEPDPDVLFRRLPSKRRNDITYGSRKGVEVRPAESADDLRAYFEIVCDWSRRKGLPAISHEPFDRMLALMGNRKLFLALVDGKIVAGSVFRFVPGGLVEYSANSSLEQFRHLKPNDLLLWRAIEWACRSGFRRLSMGGRGHWHSKLGGTLVPVYHYRLDRTFLRIHDRRDSLRELVLTTYRSLPPGLAKQVKAMLGRGRAASE